MENQNLDNTLPTPASSQAEENASLEETMPVTANQPEQGGPDLEETMPSGVNPDTQADETEPPAGSTPPGSGKKRSRWPLWTLLGLLSLVAIAAASAFTGYRSGINLRTEAQATQVAQRAKEQFDLGQQDLADGNFDRARQRFEYVIQLDPAYPGATEKLAEALMRLNATATPTTAPTPTLSPTPDLGKAKAEDLFNEAQQSLNNSDWSHAIDVLLALRKSAPDYKAVVVDDMFYTALVQRGRDKILKNGDLEGGIYDLSLAERFGPLDAESQSYIDWARQYLIGASYWEINWPEAIKIFSQVAPALPNLRDSSGMTATERYRQALIGYGDQLMKDDPCGAMDQYQAALSLGQDPKVEDALNEATKQCEGPSEPSKHKENNKPTPTEPPQNTQPPTAEPTKQEATPVPTPVPTEAPSATPYPAPGS